MALGDVYEIVDRQQYQGRDIYNVYHVSQQSTIVATIEPMALRIASGFEATVLPSVCNAQSNALVHVEIAVRNLFNPAETAAKLISTTGTRGLPVGGDYLPAWVGGSIVFDTGNGSFRRSAKRYSGLFESDQTQGVLNNGGLITAYINLGNALVSGFSLPGAVGSTQFKFCAVKRIKTVTVKGTTYRLPANAGEANVSLWTSVRVPIELKSQNSRKD